MRHAAHARVILGHILVHWVMSIILASYESCYSIPDQARLSHAKLKSGQAENHARSYGGRSQRILVSISVFFFF